ncbi:MAG: HEAT repeat domain-containing protein, partial [Nitrospirales bacterium]
DNEAIFLDTDLAKHPHPVVRSATAHALRASCSEHALPILESLLRDRAPQPRLSAARALGHIPGVAVIPILKKTLQDSEPAVRIVAAGSLLLRLSKHRENRG